MNTASQARGAVHTSTRHDSAHNHVAGQSIFIDDMPSLAGTLHAALVTSPHAHATINSIDVTAAAALPGVKAVLTAQDIPGRNDVAPIFSDEPILAEKLAEYMGHPVAIVAADTMDIARAATALVAVDYEPLEAILSIEEALERELLTSPKQTMRRGDATAAIKSAPHRITGDVSCGGQDHFYLEGHIALAVPQEDHDMLVYSSTQHPTEVQHGVATVLGIPVNAVTTETRRMGGGFGGKESQSTIIAALAALGAAHTGHPVKLRLTRDDDMVITGKRHDFLFRYDVGVDDNGRIQGIDVLLACRAGHVADLSSSVLIRALCHVDNCYYLPNAHIHGYPCKTNTVSNTGFRGFGGPQGMVAIEAIMDHIARDRGLDPDEVRRVNFYDTADRNTTHYGQVVEDNIIEDIVDRLSREIDYPARKEAVAAFNK
jgi:xanthine dehydrogenase large subunit